jgi:Uma2 family endonuclease
MSTATAPNLANPPGTTTPPPAPPGPRKWKWTREQYYQLGELGFFDGKRVELIFGEIIETSPINWPHRVGCRKTAEALECAFAGIAWVDRAEPIDLANSAPQPDVSVIPGKFEDYTDHPVTALLIVEVSDTTLDSDTTTKAELYATAGLAEYWVLDVTNRQLIVFRDPQPLAAPLKAVAYQTRLTLSPSDTVTPLAAQTVTLAVADLLP